jgi:hypothetical protein
MSVHVKAVLLSDATEYTYPDIKTNLIWEGALSYRLQTGVHANLVQSDGSYL